MKNTACKITVEATAQYIEARSNPAQERYFFIYHITIHNPGNVAAQLLERHWLIDDASGQIQEVRGEGVVGEMPRLAPGESFRYNSSAMIHAPVGTMQGEYLMVTDDGERFEAPIPPFVLSIPRVLH
ncbi:Co2+/Mg2+ efflux protein ApaG [Candidatus Woesearchaeota archaeon]|jgi:ApaG protein|nr:Co2+/Mg2+ efflux protein ApaG [Candidatus Woesearchaeota archaeon]